MNINLKETADSKIYFTSDTHFRHNKPFVYEARGYNTPDEHDTGVIDTINKIVRPNDVLWHNGDFCLNTTVDQFEGLISRINCQNVYMLSGNHPNPHYKNIYIPLVKKILGENYLPDMVVYPLRYKNVVYFGDYVEAVINGQAMVLCHYPISIWNEMAHGVWMLTGHSHYGYAQSRAENETGKILDVGWDGHGKPLSMSDVREIMNKKKFVAADEHHV